MRGDISQSLVDLRVKSGQVIAQTFFCLEIISDYLVPARYEKEKESDEDISSQRFTKRAFTYRQSRMGDCLVVANNNVHPAHSSC